MSSLATRLSSAAPVIACGIGKIINSVDDEDRAAIEAAIGSAHWSARKLADELLRAGHKNCGRTTIAVHRSAQCDCYRRTA